MIQRKPRKTSPTVAVTFTVPAPADSKQQVSVVGDFNGWDAAVNPLKRKKHADVRSVTLTLPTDSVYRFRYVTDSGDWFDDETADRFEPNEYGGKDGVLDLTNSGS
ncbi:MAG TPA: isoamylase early set domain-containing protein [Sporichthyaceae bacterium]|nr:isoamylase early set domain-containing protein [Sporichthyaceae bacterium]